MRGSTVAAYVLAISMLFVVSAAAQDDAFEMLPPEQGSTESVLGGIPANVNQWPATLVFTSDGGRCTSTVIGKRVVITAAHCVDDGDTGRVILGGGAVVVTCHHHPEYADDAQLDVALCLARSDIRLTRGSKKFETLNQSPTVPRLNNTVTLLGYGCTAEQGDNPRKILFFGEAPVKRFRAHYIVTVGDHAVCFGDSGGGAYVATSASRQMVGINSTGNIEDRSNLTNVASPPVAQFLRTWMEDNEASICGVDDGASNCL